MKYFLIVGKTITQELVRTAGDVTALPLLDDAHAVSLLNQAHMAALLTKVKTLRPATTAAEIINWLGLTDARTP